MKKVLVLKNLLLQETYMMDGNYRRTLDFRIPFADTVYFFDFPRYLCLYRVIKRTIWNHGTNGEYMGKDCPESIDYKRMIGCSKKADDII